MRPQARHAIAALVVGVGAAVARTAQADPLQANLQVEREPGAEDCADAVAMASEVQAIQGRSTVVVGGADKAVAIHVRVRRATPEASAKDGFEATIEMSGAVSGERTLSDSGPGCDVLTQAIAVSIAMSLDTSPIVRPRVNTEPAKPEPKTEERPAPSLALTLGGYYDFGTLSNAAGGLEADVDVIIPIVSFGLGFVTLPDDTNDRAHTSIVYRFFGGKARACTRQPLLELFGASLCADIVLGERRAQLTDDDTSRVSGLFVALGPQLEVSRRIVGPFGVFAELSLNIPVYQEPIHVNGTAISSPEEPVTFQMGAGLRFWIDTRPDD
ncbi:MAG: hypothetical protein U0271_40740 [Polyangiaceae bacterium]